tara:strand:- start:1378 stop:2508 length:1131 start_codon:yes stop_codon:yes gene_type:complete
MNTQKKLIIIAGLVVIFIIGYSFGNEKLPFNESIKLFYKDTFQKNSERNFESIESIFYETDVDSLIKIESSDDILSKKNNLKNFIWKTQEMKYMSEPLVEKKIYDERFVNLDNIQQIDKLTIKMEYDVNSIAYVFFPENPNNELVIYHQGHSGDFFNGYETINQLLKNNYSVIAFSMPLLGGNNQPTVQVPNLGVITLKNHNNFQHLDTEDFSSIKFFVHPISISMDYLEKNHNFKNYHMIGLSGGAWVTTLYSAIDDRILKSYAVSGPLPRFLTVNVYGNEGDYELNNSSLYNKANYLELFVMSSFGNDRLHMKIMNKYDPCCYYGVTYQTFEKNIQNKMEKLDSGTFKIHLDKINKKHSISKESMNLILSSLAT